MESSLKFNQHLAPREKLQKRLSDEAAELHDSKKRNVTEGITPHNTRLSAPTFHLPTDLPIAMDEDQPSPQRIQAFPGESRVLRRPHRTGEDEKLLRGRCCTCESSGWIMTGQQCRHCFHNRCEFCDDLKESIDDDKVGQGFAAAVNKLNELSGEVGLVLESLESSALTSSQREQLDRLWEGFELWNQHLPEMEDDEKEEAGTGKVAE